jgi:hypothetical protein
MMGDTTISDETRDKVRRRCAEAGVKDRSADFRSEQQAEAYIQELQKRMQQSPPGTI